MGDVELMAAAVAENPADEAAQAAQSALADAIAERTGDHAAARTEARMVALRVRIVAFVKHLDAIMAKHWADNNYTFAPPPTHRADYISAKWCRVVRLEVRAGKPEVASVSAFVCLADNSTKALGAVRAGDIHKPDGYIRAARHARGTVWADEFGGAVGPGGHVNYLR